VTVWLQFALELKVHLLMTKHPTIELELAYIANQLKKPINILNKSSILIQSSEQKYTSPKLSLHPLADTNRYTTEEIQIVLHP
jgi:hypothetical protein